MRRIAPHAAVALLIFLALMHLVPTSRGENSREDAFDTTLSAGPHGTRALFLLLGQLGMQVGMLRRAAYGNQPPTATLWLLGAEPLGRQDKAGLRAHLAAGGNIVARPDVAASLLGATIRPHPRTSLSTADKVQNLHVEAKQAPMAIVAAPEPLWVWLQTPEHDPIVAAWQVGAGTLVALGAQDITRNGIIEKADNGIFLARLAQQLGQRHIFDEVKTGFGDSGIMQVLWQVPYRWALLQAAAAGAIILLLLAMRRYPLQAPEIQLRRRALDHVEAVAQLWRGAHDAALPLRAILHAIDARAIARLGGQAQNDAFITWLARAKPELRAQAQDCWQRGQALAAHHKPDTDAARQVIQTLIQLEKKGMSW